MQRFNFDLSLLNKEGSVRMLDQIRPVVMQIATLIRKSRGNYETLRPLTDQYHQILSARYAGHSAKIDPKRWSKIMRAMEKDHNAAGHDPFLCLGAIGAQFSLMIVETPSLELMRNILLFCDAMELVG